jgi:hypothetical protein
VRRYDAIIWDAAGNPGVRVSVLAESIQEAKRLLEAEHGVWAVFNLHNEEDAAKPR